MKITAPDQIWAMFSLIRKFLSLKKSQFCCKERKEKKTLIIGAEGADQSKFCGRVVAGKHRAWLGWAGRAGQISPDPRPEAVRSRDLIRFEWIVHPPLPPPPTQIIRSDQDQTPFSVQWSILSLSPQWPVPSPGFPLLSEKGKKGEGGTFSLAPPPPH